MVEAFGRELAQVDRPADGRDVAVDDRGVDDSRGPPGVLGADDLGRQVQDQSDGREAGRASAPEEWSAVLGLRVRGAAAQQLLR